MTKSGFIFHLIMKYRLRIALLLFAWLQPVAAFALVLAVDPRNTGVTQDGTAARPFATLDAAIAAASQGDTLKVAQGTYPPVVLRKGIRLLGGFSGASVAEYAAGQPGDFSASDPAAHASILKGTDSAAAVDLDASSVTVQGFTITGGKRGIDFSGWEEIEDIRIAGNVIEKNGDAEDGDQNGGGIAFHGTRVAIVDNIIRGNVAGNRGAAIARNGDPVDFRIEGNLIADNIGYGDHAGGIYLDGTGSLARNVIERNRCCEGTGYGWGGGVFVYGYGKGLVRMTGNIIRDNRAGSIGGGVFIDEGGRAILDHELIYGNSTGAGDKGGAGIYVDGAFDGTPSSATLINCTVANNRSPGTSGGNGLYVEFCGRRVFVSNSIFWGNGGGDDFFLRTDSDQIVMTHSLSQEKWAGAGNVATDPLFADTAAGDFRLRSKGGRWKPTAGGGGAWVTDAVSSPAIDAGNPDSGYGLEPAPNGGRIDMGAFGNTTEASKGGASGISRGGSPGQAALLRHFRVRWVRNAAGTYALSFEAPVRGRVLAEVEDARGRRMTTLLDAVVEAGNHRAEWKGLPDAEGFRFCRLQVAGFTLIAR